MEKNLTEIVFILDRSGSMGGLESDTIGGFNSMLKKQRRESGEAFLTTVLFDDKYEVLHNHRNINYVSEITEKDYFVRGCTALLDAVGITIRSTANRIKKLKFEEKPDKVIFVITTDGMENASNEYTYEMINNMVAKQKEKYAWEFIFLGANINAAKEGSRFGIDEDMTCDYNSDAEGTMLNYRVVSEAISEFRIKKKINKDWKKEIQEDYINRGK